MRYAVYDDPTFSFSNFSIQDIEYADVVNPGDIRTWSTDFNKFRARDGKLLTFHGRRDPVSGFPPQYLVC
jgi:feruloyl esterase